MLTGASSSYSAIPGRELSGNLEVVGKDTLLLTAIQARNNARALFAGSLSFFSNQYFDAKLSTTGQVGAFRSSVGPQPASRSLRVEMTSCPQYGHRAHTRHSSFVCHIQVAGNRALAVEVSKWVLGERGVLRASDVQHRRADGYVPTPPHPQTSTSHTTDIHMPHPQNPHATPC